MTALYERARITLWGDMRHRALCPYRLGKEEHEVEETECSCGLPDVIDDFENAIEAKYAPLLEAARAYRDAHARHWNNRGRYGAGLDAAMDALCEAARTFEADQEGR